MLNVEPDLKYDFDDVLIKQKRSNAGSRADISLMRRFVTLHSKQEIICCPIAISNLDSTGTFEMSKSAAKNHCLVALHKFYSNQEIHQFFQNNHVGKKTFYTIGIKEVDYNKLQDYCDSYGYPILLCLDAANGATTYFENRLQQIRKLCPYSVILAGNVCTPETTYQLLLSGADIVKIGVGPGNLCTTRMMTGVGYNQLSAIADAADIAHGMNGHIMADGGIKIVGDFAKAFCAGADFVMSGSFFCGVNECQGEWDTYYNILDKKHYRRFKASGMSSEETQIKYYGGMSEYKVSEGRTQWFNEKGPFDKVLKQVQGGLRSCGSYIGATSIKDFAKCATFTRIK